MLGAAPLWRRSILRQDFATSIPCSPRFSSCPHLLSGHNRWSKIKHDKAKEDAGKTKVRSMLARELRLATQLYGPDPNTNPRLQLAITNAKKSSFPKASIEAAIARGQGLSISGASLETLTIEAMLPPSVAVVVECHTDNRNRTLQDVRTIIKNVGGSLASTAYFFEKKGRVVFEKNRDTSIDGILDQAIELGAVDVDEDEEGRIVVLTEPSNTMHLATAMSKTGLKIESSDIVWDANQETMVDIESDEAAKKLDECVAAIQDDPSVQGVYLNAS